MGHVYQRVKLSAERTVTVRMLVDTGATYSVLPEALARAVGIKRLRRSVPITLADKRRVKLDAGTAIFRIGEREARQRSSSVTSPSRSSAWRRSRGWG